MTLPDKDLKDRRLPLRAKILMAAFAACAYKLMTSFDPLSQDVPKTHTGAIILKCYQKGGYKASDYLFTSVLAVKEDTPKTFAVTQISPLTATANISFDLALTQLADTTPHIVSYPQRHIISTSADFSPKTTITLSREMNKGSFSPDPNQPQLDFFCKPR